MYIPTYYREKNQQKLIEFMQAHNFALVINCNKSAPLATHLPIVVEQRESRLFLVSHMARVNPQWETFADNEILVVFQGPHAYISPQHYEKKQNVPTWNYIAVHAHGKARIIDDQDEVVSLMERTIHKFEKEYYKQWKDLSPEYVNGMLKGITAFEIEVSNLEGKFKLSQNKTKIEQQNIINTFEKSDDDAVKGIADEMKKKL